MILNSHSVEKTQKIAKDFAAEILNENNGNPVVIAFKGELGAGKTTFIQAFSEGLGLPREKIKSPTFVLMRKYNLENMPNYNKLYHFDCYRLRDEKDLIPLGIEEIMKEKGNIILIEWAERVRKILLKERITVHIDHIAENERKILISK